MTKLNCPADILHEKEWRAAYGNRCNAIFLSELMQDEESMRKTFHLNGRTHGITPLVGIFLDYYKDHDKERMLDRVKEATTNADGTDRCGDAFCVEEWQGKRTLRDWSVYSTIYGGNEESPWANLSNYECRATTVISDDFGSGQSVSYNNKSVAEVLRETVEKTTFLEKQIKKPTGNERLDFLVQKLQNKQDEKLHIPTYAFALRLINNDLTFAFEGQKEPLDPDAYVPAIIMLDEMSAEVFNQIDYRQQRTFHQSDLGQEMLRFSYLTTQRMYEKKCEGGFSEAKMNAWLEDIKKTDLWQVAQRKITQEIVGRWARRARVGSLLNNRMIELATIKPCPKEDMYAAYWKEDSQRAMYMNLYANKMNQH